MSQHGSALPWWVAPASTASPRVRSRVVLQVLGARCPESRRLAELTVAVARELRLEHHLEWIDDPEVMVALGATRTPALVVNGVLMFSGSLPSLQELTGLLSKLPPMH